VGLDSDEDQSNQGFRTSSDECYLQLNVITWDGKIESEIFNVQLNTGRRRELLLAVWGLWGSKLLWLTSDTSWTVPLKDLTPWRAWSRRKLAASTENLPDQDRLPGYIITVLR